MSLQDFAEYPRVHYNTAKSAELGKLASVVSGDQQKETLREKAALDAQIVDDLEKIGSRLMKNLKLLKSEDLGKMLAIGGVGGLGSLAGAAYAGNRAEEAAKEKTQQAIMAALGIAGAAYGLGRRGSNEEKSASHHAANIEKLAAAAEVALKTRSVVYTTENSDLRKYAAEVMVTANAHVADLLGKTIL